MNRQRPTAGARERIFASDCDRCEQVSEEERADVEYMSNRISETGIKALGLRVCGIHVGGFLKPIARDSMDRFVIEMDSRNLRGRHVAMIVQNVLARLDKYLHEAKK